jgi:hypothetical protein
MSGLSGRPESIEADRVESEGRCFFREARILHIGMGFPNEANPWINMIFSNVCPENYSLVARGAEEKNSVHSPLA